MGRPREGFRIRPQRGTDKLAVEWTEGVPGSTRGRKRQRSTGESDACRASEVGARIYAAAMRGELAPTIRASRLASDDLASKGGQWLATRADLDPDTRKAYANALRKHLVPRFTTLEDVCADSVQSYSAGRLMVVLPQTVRHELSVLRQLVAWSLGGGDRAEQEARRRVPGVSKRVRGVNYERSSGLRRRGKPTELTEAEILAIIAALPEWSRLPRQLPKLPSGATRDGRFPIRARFVFKYETGLRESLLDQLRTPEHWDPANPSELRITPELDKIRFARVVTLTPVAQAALSSVVHSIGSRSSETGKRVSDLIFGAHDYRSSIRSAARRCGLSSHRVATLAPNDLRHARATHLGSHPAATMAGMMHMFGWRQPQTAARYMHPTQGAQAAMLAATSGTKKTTAHDTASSAAPSATPQLPHNGAHDEQPQDPPDDWHGFG